MANPVLLDNIAHKDLKVRSFLPTQAGNQVSVARVFPGELRQVQPDYPVFFTRDTTSGNYELVALFGFSPKENLYLVGGAWDAQYIPLSIRRQPFLIGYQQKFEDGVPVRAPVVHIDLDHPGVSEEEGEPIFLEHGGASPLLESITSVLMAIHSGHELGAIFVDALIELDLIEPVTLEMRFDDGSSQNLSGLYTLNEEALNGLPAEKLAQLQQHQFLQYSYLILASMANVQKLVNRKNTKLKALKSCRY